MSLDKTIITKRLTYIKYLYQQGVEQSKLPEVIAGFALMQFHDCIEMFLLLVAENLGKKDYTKWPFMQYWAEINTLTMRDAMNIMKQRRVSLKHHGSFPSHDDVVECRINVGTFLQENVKIQFGIDFEAISLVELVSYESVRSPLSIAVQNMADGKLYDSLVQSCIAFSNLLEDYEGTKMHWYHSILEIGKKQGDKYKNFVKNASLKNANNNMAWFKEISETTNELRDVAKITALGIDFKKYALFKAVTPHIIRFIGEGDSIESEESLSKRVNISEDLCNICINFVIESAVRLQETDYDLSEYLKGEM